MIKQLKKASVTVLLGVVLVLHTSLALAILPKAKSLPLQLKGRTHCTWFWGTEVKVNMEDFLQEVSNELVIYDYEIRPALQEHKFTIDGIPLEVKGYIDFSNNKQRYIPQAITKGLAEIINYDLQDCLFIENSLVIAYQEQVESLRRYSNELSQVDVFLDKLSKLTEKRNVSLKVEPIIWLGDGKQSLEIQYTKSMIKELIDMGEISIRSPSIFDFKFIPFDKGKKQLAAEVDIVASKDMEVLDQLIITYVNDSWRIMLSSY